MVTSIDQFPVLDLIECHKTTPCSSCCDPEFLIDNLHPASATTELWPQPLTRTTHDAKFSTGKFCILHERELQIACLTLCIPHVTTSPCQEGLAGAALSPRIIPTHSRTPSTRSAPTAVTGNIIETSRPLGEYAIRHPRAAATTSHQS